MQQPRAHALTRLVRHAFASPYGSGYALVAGFAVLFVARTFYFAMLRQTGGEWSAPLDDVFIHFDYARATARGYPFEWSEGNGYSSGNTSITYPFVLAFGYWIGFRETLLMVWAAIVGCTSTFVYLLGIRRLAPRLPRYTSYLLPAATLAVGALDWSLLSGMEVAFFLAVWVVGLRTALMHATCPAQRIPALGWRLGLVGAAIVATRPEGATSTAVLGFTAAALVWRHKRDTILTVGTVVRAGLPGIGFLALQALVNRALSGYSAPAGALVKLAIYNPYMTTGQKWDEYLFHLRYAFARNLHHHFADVPVYGWIPVVLAAVALADRRTRLPAVVLMASALSFLGLVATNGQVRWQNERYTMPAVAWVLAAAGLGLGVLVAPPTLRWPRRAVFAARVALAVVLSILFGVHQAPNMRDQVWFFARASRNIRDQHTTVGRLLRNNLSPTPSRVLVGDAGALIYASDLPGLDIIGLGGFRDLPFARAHVHGMGATVELLERIPLSDRPDVMAIYPTWWGKFPLWFGHHITSVWVEGNVICGGAEKAIYRADWHLLGSGSRPSTVESSERIVDEVDVADLISEAGHRYNFPQPAAGFVDLRILSDPLRPQHDVLDAGRRIPQDRSECFEMTSPIPGATRILVRVAPPRKARLEMAVDGALVHTWAMEPSDRWVELGAQLPTLQVGRPHGVCLTPRDGGDLVDYHVWLVVSP